MPDNDVKLMQEVKNKEKQESYCDFPDILPNKLELLTVQIQCELFCAEKEEKCVEILVFVYFDAHSHLTDFSVDPLEGLLL